MGKYKRVDHNKEFTFELLKKSAVEMLKSGKSIDDIVDNMRDCECNGDELNEIKFLLINTLYSDRKTE